MAKHAAAKHSGIQSAVYVFDVYRIEYLIVTIVFSGYVFCTWHKRASLQDLLMERMLEPPSMKAGARVKIIDSQISCPLGHSAEEQSKRA